MCVLQRPGCKPLAVHGWLRLWRFNACLRLVPTLLHLAFRFPPLRFPDCLPGFSRVPQAVRSSVVSCGGWPNAGACTSTTTGAQAGWLAHITHAGCMGCFPVTSHAPCVMKSIKFSWC